MKLKDLWEVSPQSHVFVVIRNKDLRMTTHEEYRGGSYLANRTVAKITAKSYPNYKSVLEVELK